MLEPTKAEVFHNGTAQMKIVPKKPMMDKSKPRTCLQQADMMKLCRSLQGGMEGAPKSCNNLSVRDDFSR